MPKRNPKEMQHIMSDCFYINQELKKIHKSKEIKLPTEMIGEVYNNLEVIDVYDEALYVPNKTFFFKCKCRKCGKIQIVSQDKLNKIFCLCPPLLKKRTDNIALRVNDFEYSVSYHSHYGNKNKMVGVPKVKIYVRNQEAPVSISPQAYWFVSEYCWYYTPLRAVYTLHIPEDVKNALHTASVGSVCLYLNRLIYCDGDAVRAICGLPKDLYFNKMYHLEFTSSAIKRRAKHRRKRVSELNNKTRTKKGGKKNGNQRKKTVRS